MRRTSRICLPVLLVLATACSQAPAPPAQRAVATRTPVAATPAITAIEIADT